MLILVACAPGTVNIATVARATAPTVVAPQEFSHPENVVIAYDGEKSILRALEYAVSSPLFDGMPIHLIMAGEESETRRGELERVVLTISANGRNADWSFLPGAPDKVIADYMADRPSSIDPERSFSVLRRDPSDVPHSLSSSEKIALPLCPSVM